MSYTATLKDQYRCPNTLWTKWTSLADSGQASLADFGQGRS